MALTPGTRLGPYDILAPLGAGGMGEVYKARDTRLARTVAIKVLPADTAADASARARFEREARAIAALSHPHICVVYDVGHQAPSTGSGPGIDYLVMELLEGETLLDRLAKAKGPLPLEQVLSIGVAIADALDKAHRAGIVHRDLKPANVMLTKSGPKLLDFGLAKLQGAASPVSLSDGSAATTAGPGTAQGTILGTIHYMAPEQVEGREADPRTDIWALGALLYEMATGQRPFTGESAASIVAAIMQGTPPRLSTRQPLTPPAFEHLVERCLAKDPNERWQSISDIGRQLEWLAKARASGPATPARAKRARGRLAAGVLAGAVATAAIALAASWLRPEQSPAAPAERTTLAIVPPEGIRMVGGSAISPDGRNFVYVGLGPDAAPSLWLYSLESGVSRELPGTSDASYPFWSPRSDTIGFFATSQLKTVTLNGAAPRVLAPASSGRGGTWRSDGVILYAPVSNGSLYRIPAQGGTPELALPVEPGQGQVGYRYPSVVDERHFTYELQAGPSKVGVYLWSDDTQSATRLTSSAYSNTAFVDGRLFYVENGMLVSRALDAEHGRFTSDATDVAGPVAAVGGIGSGYWPFSLSTTGVLAYPSGRTGSALIAPRWLDRQGRIAGDFLPEADVSAYGSSYGLRLSPDGRRVAFNALQVATNDVYVADIERNVATRFTTDDANDQYAVWSPDGTEIVFASNRSGFYNLYRRSSSGNDAERSIATASSNQYPTDWSSDGRLIVFTSLDPKSQVDIWTRPADGQGAPTPYLRSSANEVGGRLSPDGRWMAYVSDESGRFEVYVQRFPEGGDKMLISVQGGSEPQWRSDGRELFYVGANRALMAVPMQAGATLTAGRPAKVFETLVDTTLGSFGQTHYTATRDGQTFLVTVSPDSTPPMMLVQDWAVPVCC